MVDIQFSFPVTCPDEDQKKSGSCRNDHETARLRPVRLDTEPYEVLLEERGLNFQMIFGGQSGGNFLCIPNWQFGCGLSCLSDEYWNLNAVLEAEPSFDPIDACAISRALSVIGSELLPGYDCLRQKRYLGLLKERIILGKKSSSKN